jgi:hydroxymethylpyrimidine pyrophosphatase-like HAD family hydrolase
MQLIVLDIDGVLAKGEAEPFDLSLLERLRRLNQAARAGAGGPAVTLNTGRPSAYVEAVGQAIAAWQPALFESGAGLYLPQSYRFQTSPLFSLARQAGLAEGVRRLDELIVRPGKAYWQPGKTVCHTLFALPPLNPTTLRLEVETMLEDLSAQLSVVSAGPALNIQPAGINKGTGLQWLAEVTGIDPGAMAGVGDSAADVDFLRLVGYPAAPANAIPAVKAVARYLASEPDSAGLHQILDYWL